MFDQHAQMTSPLGERIDAARHRSTGTFVAVTTMYGAAPGHLGPPT